MRVGLALLFSLACVPVASAGSGGGRFVNFDTGTSTEDLADGTKLVTVTYEQMVLVDEGSLPVPSSSQSCSNRVHVNAEGEPISSTGECIGFDGEGNTVFWWWKTEESRTESCPTSCGTFSYFGGTGKYASIEGTGTFQVDRVFPNGVLTGSWKASIKVK